MIEITGEECLKYISNHASNIAQNLFKEEYDFMADIISIKNHTFLLREKYPDNFNVLRLESIGDRIIRASELDSKPIIGNMLSELYETVDDLKPEI